MSPARTRCGTVRAESPSCAREDPHPRTSIAPIPTRNSVRRPCRRSRRAGKTWKRVCRRPDRSHRRRRASLQCSYTLSSWFRRQTASKERGIIRDAKARIGVRMNRILSVLRRKVADYSSGRSPGLGDCSRSCPIASPSPIFRPSGIVKRLPSLTVAGPRRFLTGLPFYALAGT